MIVTKIKDLFSKALIILSFFLFLSIFVYINYIASPSFKAPVLKSLALTLGFLLIFIAVDYFMDKFKNKKAAGFGSYGWSGESPKIMTEQLKACGFDVIEEGLGVLWKPDDETLETCKQYGVSLAQKL